MTASRRPEQPPRPPEPCRSGIQGQPTPDQPGGASNPTERRETTRNLPEDPTLPSEQHAFRATFLWRFHRSEVISAFRIVGDALCDLQNEAGAWGPKGGPSITWSEIAAACEDLGHLAVYLNEVAGERTASELDEVSEALTVNAGRWAGQLASLVLDMRRSLDRAAEVLDRDAGKSDNGTE